MGKKNPKSNAIAKCPKTNKTQYKNRRLAERGITWIWSRDPTVKQGDLHTYVCPYCDYIHIGHKKLRGRAKP